MQKVIVITIAAILLVGIASATIALFLFPYNPLQPPSADSSEATPEGMRKVADSNNQFAFEIYKKFDKDENLFYSPYSISSALAMTYEGARGNTADEIKKVFHFPENNVLRPNFAGIYNEINKGDKNYELRTGNALWVQNEFPLLGDYTSPVDKYYGGKTANLDFVNEPKKSVDTINSFIAQQTNDKIENLLAEGDVNAMTRLILTNAIYFKGRWEWEFDKSDTQKQDFTISQDNIIKTDMMNMRPKKAEAKFNYADLGDLQIIELPYKDKEVSMVIILPNESLSDIEDDLTYEKINEYKSDMKETKLSRIALPKFEFDTKYSLVDSLNALGMKEALTPSADFSGMTGAKDLFIGNVIHQAYVKVDEEGTEAAAATAVVMELTSARPPMIRDYFVADHPFVFLIQDNNTGEILFVGRVVNPNQ